MSRSNLSLPLSQRNVGDADTISIASAFAPNDAEHPMPDQGSDLNIHHDEKGSNEDNDSDGDYDEDRHEALNYVKKNEDDEEKDNAMIEEIDDEKDVALSPPSTAGKSEVRIDNDGREKKGLSDDEDDGSDIESIKGGEPGEKYETGKDAREVGGELEEGEQWVFKQKWYELWRPRHPPPPPPISLDDAPMTPLATANFLSVVFFFWVTPILTLGYQRPLAPSDLWRLDESRETEYLNGKLERAWEKRVKKCKQWNEKVVRGEVKPGVTARFRWIWEAGVRGRWATPVEVLPDIANRSRPWTGTYRERMESFEKRWKEKDGFKEPSLAWSLSETMGMRFWVGGLFKVFGDISSLCAPFVTKAIITFAQKAYVSKKEGHGIPDLGRGIAMCFGIALLQIANSVGQHQFFWRSMTSGALARAALIGSLYQRGVHLSPTGRAANPPSALVNDISTNVSRIDLCCQWMHVCWTAVIQLGVCLAILITQLGPSAIAGFSLFFFLLPIQSRLMKWLVKLRKKSMVWTEQRAKIIQEVLANQRIVKYFAYEVPFLNRIADIRRREMVGVASILNIRSANLAIAISIPALSTVVSFTIYAASGHSLDPAIIFPCLTWFGLIRQPLMLLPRALSTIADAQNAIARLSVVFHAETIENPIVIDPDIPCAIRAERVSFAWGKPQPVKKEKKQTSALEKPGKEKRMKRRSTKLWVFKRFGRSKKIVTVDNSKTPITKDDNAASEESPFEIPELDLTIAKGKLTAFVGPVGSGKSSLLAALLGEMKKSENGTITFSGSIAYCPQQAFILNATLRENVLFGKAWDEGRYWNALKTASLLPDLAVLPDGDLSEIGEKGINLSGGQKQRVSIARALYADSDILLFDDPLSACDAGVALALFQNVILGSRSKGKTVVLVTHALYLLSDADFINTMLNGRIAESGTYEELIGKNGNFARLIHEFGGEKGDEEEDLDEGKKSKAKALDEKKEKRLRTKTMGGAAGTGKLEGRLVQSEKRIIGSISKNVYLNYAKSGKGWVTVPLIIITSLLMQGAQIINTYFIIWWEHDSFHQPQGFYMGIYAVTGVATAITTYLLGSAIVLMSINASKNIHNHSLNEIFRAPMSFFDSTPVGRILNVLGKDVDTMDNVLADSLRITLLTFGMLIGSVVIIAIFEPYFLCAILVAGIGYFYFSLFYRSSAREIKRMDGIFRSAMYQHFAESLSGLSTLRAFGSTERFIKDNRRLIDIENRAYFLTSTNQRWLAMRIDLAGSFLVLVVAILTVTGASGASPSQVGLVLTYAIQLSGMLSVMIRQTAETENNMNAVERISQFQTLEHEAPNHISETAPPSSWPEKGEIEMKNVSMSYRSNLAPVLKNISLHIRPREKIGVVGRTGAGKSSLMTILFRLVEPTGSIMLDQIDISTLGLTDLRSKLAIIPQDPLLFSGTLRSNLDPFQSHDDATLYSALRRAHLISEDSSKTKTPPRTADDQGVASPTATLHERSKEEREDTSGHRRSYTLDSAVEFEGSNFSVGERSLISLARALVRDSQVIVMDEATAAVDLETDAKIQQTIQSEFAHKTLLTIAHRLRSILSYDRILVMEQGKIAEFDTPLNLFSRRDGIFRGMCDRSDILQEEIERATRFKD